MNKEVDTNKKEASHPIGCWFSDPLDSGITLPSINWHLITDGCIRPRRSASHKTKANIDEFTIEQLNKTREQGRPGEVLWMDCASKNKSTETRCQFLNCQLNVEFECTARPTPQQNSRVDTCFAFIAAK